MRARNLTVQINNDTKKTLDSVVSELLPYIDSFGDPVHDWVSAIRRTSALRLNNMPDLICQDVHYELDETSPLSEALKGTPQYPKPLPTGLGYLRQYASLSSGLERPLGIAIHSYHTQAGIWRDLWRARHPAGALAISEIGLLAAVLGDGEAIAGDNASEAGLATLGERCLEWLKEQTAETNNIASALPVALKNYRRRLVTLAGVERKVPGVMLAPSEWTRVSKWLETMRRNPRELTDEDFITLTYSDGSTDSIRLLSLFADCNLLDSHALAAEAFNYGDEGESETPVWQRTSGGKPQIGRFLYKLSTLPDAFLEATSVVSRFPSVLMPETQISRDLDAETRVVSYPEMTAAFGVLLQAVRREHASYSICLLYTSPSPRDQRGSRMPSSA